MNKRLVVVLTFAAVISAAASLLLYRLLASKAGANRGSYGVDMIVAAKQLKAGSTIRDSDIKTVRWTGPVIRDSSRKKEDAIGRGVLADILEGEPVMEARLAARGAGGGLAAAIPPGMRAVAIRVNDVVSVAGFVLPGTRVDVLMSANAPRGLDGIAVKLTRTILQNVEVLSAGKNTEKDSEGKPVNVPVMNLLVTPEQAEILSLASNEAKIQLVLRNPLDRDVAKTPGSAMDRLLLGESARAALEQAEPKRSPVPASRPRVQKVAPQTFTVEVIQGTKRTDTSFPVVAGARP